VITPDVSLPQRNHAIETLFLDRPHESLGVRIRVRGALGCQDHADAGVAKLLSHGAAPFPVPIPDQHTMSDQHAVISRRHEAHDLAHEHVIGMGRGSDDVDTPAGQVDDEHRAPRRILLRHADDQSPDVERHAAPAGPSTVRPFPGDQLTMPAQQGVGRRDRGID
jgi:hypothetical protein